ncbi:hypothetical protein [Streptomyces sp. NPDC047009]
MAFRVVAEAAAASIFSDLEEPFPVGSIDRYEIPETAPCSYL